MSNPRKAVISALIKLENDGGYSNLSLNALINGSDFSNVDKGFISRLFYGVIERKITLDYYISKISKRPIKKLSAFILNALRTALYQIEYMDKIPDSAAVNETVKIVKSSKENYASGYVNGCLRSFLREKPQLPDGNSPKDYSVKYSCPEWFISELIDYVGCENAIAFLEDSLTPPPVYARVNTRKITKSDLLEKYPELFTDAPFENALTVCDASGIENREAYKNGFFHIEDIASQIAVSALAIKDGESVLDICAAPGGKTATAAQYTPSGRVLSCDIYPKRVKLIREKAQLLSLNNITTAVNNAEVFSDKFPLFDKIICDVPCSGFGVIRRKPEIKYKPIEELTNLTSLQYNILETTAKYLKPGGILMYSTCTLRKAENEETVEKFLKNHKEFSVLKSAENVRLLPNKNFSDGFFYTIIIKETSEDE